MRKRILIALCGNLLGVVALALVLAWAVGAQEPEPGLSFGYVDTFGETRVPYFSTTTHLNHPCALAVDGTDNVYIAERNGHRVLKYDSNGTFQLQIGLTGVCVGWEEGRDGLCGPLGLVVDSSGNIWVADWASQRVATFAPDGTYIRHLGVFRERGSDNEHFNRPEGVAFDSEGRIYVADRQNHRVQIFDPSGVYSATIGGTCGPEDYQLCRPQGLTIGNGDVLYVADTANGRVQVYQLLGDSMVFSQSITTTGTTDFDWVPGVAVDADYLYVAHGGQVHVFSRSGVYSSTIDGGCWGGANDWFCSAEDVAVDSEGHVYVADTWEHFQVMKCSGGPNWACTPFAGTQGVPYPTDDHHFYEPSGVAVVSNSILVLEYSGQRLIKLDTKGEPQWTVGVPGISGSDNAHFNCPSAVAVDSIGRSYVADTLNHRVQIFDSTGVYRATLGVTGECGSDNNHFCWPEEVAVDSSGNIYVGDNENHRVQIFDSTLAYLDTLHLDRVPGGLTVDSGGNIYVTDWENHQVQIFDSNGDLLATLGETGVPGSDNAHFNQPRDVAVDASGRIYVSDGWNRRVQVFDSNGDYLTTIGSGEAGPDPGLLHHPGAIDVDSAFNVYVTDDGGTHRVQKFALNPIVETITGPPVDPVEVNTEITTSADFTNPDVHDDILTHTAEWDWGDGSTSSGTIQETGSGTVTGSHTYTTTGVYTVKLTVTDDDGGSAESVFRYIVVYDPEGGFVTGGGWIDSPEGAYTPDPSLAGKATFGFVAKYKKGADTPTGETEFRFRVADLNFHSDTYQWLVIAGPKAQFKGDGTINGSGDYGFMLKATDGEVNGGGGVDKFRIKIWEKATEELIYDNQMGDFDDAELTTAIGGGSIVVHKEK